MRCNFCGGPAHPATGSQLGPRTIACKRCNDEFWTWARSHTNKRPRKSSKSPPTRETFYEAAGKFSEVDARAKKGNRAMRSTRSSAYRASRGMPGTRDFFPQSILFDRRIWTPRNAVKWAARHGYRSDKIDIKPNTIRLRQADPDTFRPGSFATVEYGKGIQAVFGHVR